MFFVSYPLTTPFQPRVCDPFTGRAAISRTRPRKKFAGNLDHGLIVRYCQRIESGKHLAFGTSPLSLIRTHRGFDRDASERRSRPTGRETVARVL